MSYAVWCGGELIGHTDLHVPGLGFVRCRSGHFHPTERGTALMPVLAVASQCMRAYMHRSGTDAEGRQLAHPDYIGSPMFADVAEALQRVAQFGLELRDVNNVVVPTSEIGIQDSRGESLDDDREM